MKLIVTNHAKLQAETRNIPIQDVYDAALERLTAERVDAKSTSVAVRVGETTEGWKGGSNGNIVWAIVREGVLHTVMFRRIDQPSTSQALRVMRVID